MAANFVMGWEPKNRLWRKTYRKRAYVISCSQLAEWSGKPVDETKEGSYQTANAWWLAKKAEIDGAKPPHRYAYLLNLFGQNLAIARSEGQGALAEGIRAEIERVQGGELPGFLPEGFDDEVKYEPTPKELAEWETYHRSLPPSPTDEELRQTLEQYELGEALNPSSEVWAERRRIAKEPVSEDRTIAHQVKLYLAAETIRYEAGALSASELDTVRRCLRFFRDWIGGDLLVDQLNAVNLDRYWQHLVQYGQSTEYKKKRLRFARAFIEWNVERGLIPPLANLRSRRHKFGGGASAIRLMELETVRLLINKATGQLKLHLYLMINCGMYQSDISDLLQTEVDWKEGRIIRRRSKTKNHPNPPLVNYKLWPETFDLLCKYRENEGPIVLLTRTKRRWVRDRNEGESRKKTDAFKSNYNRLTEELELKTNKSAMLLRKTSASLLKKDDVFQHYDQYFLGHAPATVADRCYSVPSDEIFHRGLAWLRKQYFPNAE